MTSRQQRNLCRLNIGFASSRLSTCKLAKTSFFERTIRLVELVNKVVLLYKNWPLKWIRHFAHQASRRGCITKLLNGMHTWHKLMKGLAKRGALQAKPRILAKPQLDKKHVCHLNAGAPPLLT